MKQSFKKITLIAFLSLALGLVSCAVSSGTSSTSDESTSTFDTSSSSSSSQWIDYAKDGTVKLTLDYTNRTFATDGVEKVSLKTTIDGDTAHFTMADGNTLKSRFFGIDTPESTGKVQPYGKAASNYTKEKLTNANKNGTIVISSPSTSYGKPEPDSTGTRYVSLVWINETVQNASLDELYLLNLEIVEDGLSWVKNVAEMPQFSDTFYAAETQAKNFKLNLHSGEDDPLFNYGDYEDVSLLDVKKEILANIADSTHTNTFAGKNVRVQGTVAGFANHVLYIENYYTQDEGAATSAGEYAGINIFVGMSAIPSKFTTINAYIQVCGVASDSENFGFQISGANFPIVSYDENDAKVLIKASDNTDEHKLHTFEYTADEFSTVIANADYSALMSSVKITTDVTVSKTYASEDNEITLYFGSLKFTCYIAFSYVGDSSSPNWFWSESDFADQTFKLSGVFSFHKTSSGKFQFQINPSSSSDLVWVR